MKRWMFAAPDSDIYRVQADLQVGGAFSILEWSGTEHIDHFGHYEVIEVPRRLVFTLLVPKHFLGRTRVALDIAEHGDVSQFVFEPTGVDPHVVEDAWRSMFDALA
jgi:uncharacterized protein YndB with AHSA1/START domain